jgi:hypothetical protein
MFAACLHASAKNDLYFVASVLPERDGSMVDVARELTKAFWADFYPWIGRRTYDRV